MSNLLFIEFRLGSFFLSVEFRGKLNIVVKRPQLKTERVSFVKCLYNLHRMNYTWFLTFDEVWFLNRQLVLSISCQVRFLNQALFSWVSFTCGSPT